MKGKMLGIVLFAVMVVSILAPVRANAAGGHFYMIGKGGATFAISRDTGYAGELGFGCEWKSGVDIFGYEATVGYFSQSGDIPTPDKGQLTSDSYMAPVSVTFKTGVQFTSRIRAEAGMGLNVAWVSTDFSGHSDSGALIKDSDSEIVYGYHGLSRVTFDITDKVFLGIEYKYIDLFNNTTKPIAIHDQSGRGGYTLTPAPISQGYMLMAVVGFRF